MNKFRVKTGDASYEINRDANGVFHCDGDVVESEFLKLGSRRYMLRIEGLTYEIEAFDDPVPGRPLTLAVNGKPVVIELDDTATLLMKRFEGETSTKVHAAALRAPMPGKVSRILVNEGELVEPGQGLVILEAMKMENELRSPAAGIVKKIRVKETDAVEKNALLIEIS